jgi:hypothetical protein
MMDTTISSDEPFSDDLSDDPIDDVDALSDEIKCATIDTRRRLEEKLAQRNLEKDLREFDFDL